MQYKDFDVSIELVAGRSYRIAVLHSPAGEAQEVIDFPFDAVALKLHLTQLENALLKSGNRRRRVPTESEQTVLDFGAALFNFLMTGEIGRRYAVSQDRCRQVGAGLRIKLRIQDPAMAALPWEFIYDRRFDEYLALSQRTPLIRYLELPRPLIPLQVAPPLRILGLVASPADLPPLDVDVEKARIAEALADLQADGIVELHWMPQQSWRDLQRTLRRGPWHVFHFIGHGSFDVLRDEGYLLFADRNGNAQRMTATNLGRLLGDHDALRLVLLNACEGGMSGTDVFSSTAATLVRSSVPCVVAMQHEITDRAAIEFARTFYEALADGLPLESAISDARKSVTFSREQSLEWGTPVLFTHTPDGVLFDLTSAAKEAPQAKEEKPAKPDTRLQQQTTATGTRRKPSPWQLNARGLPLITSWEQLRQGDSLPARIVWAKDDKEMALIPSGSFTMGTTTVEAHHQAKQYGFDAKWTLAETPQRTITLSDYYMDVTAVTHSEYARFLAENSKHNIPNVTEDWGKPYNWDKKNRQPPRELLHHPVVLVSWEDAQAYAHWSGKALPTEEQWEKGARGADARHYPWGNEWDSTRLNSAERLAGKEIKSAKEWTAWWAAEQAVLLKQVNTMPVGSFHSGSSPYGLLDMAGNIWEWCDTWYAAYPGSEAQHDDFGRKYRVVRGGSWNYIIPNSLRCAFRGRIIPHYRNDFVGFRCASTAF